jgi:hypothetical protein
MGGREERLRLEDEELQTKMMNPPQRLTDASCFGWGKFLRFLSFGITGAGFLPRIICIFLQTQMGFVNFRRFQIQAQTCLAAHLQF